MLLNLLTPTKKIFIIVDIALKHSPPQLMNFLPPKHLRNPHLQSIMNSVGPRKIKARYLIKRLRSTNLVLKAKDGTRLLGEYDTNDDSHHAVVVLLHGWEGSSKSSYLVTTANTLLNNGFHVLRLNFRDHGNTHHMNHGIFNCTMTEEVSDVIKYFFEKYEYKTRFIAGFSLGGNFALRIAADHGKELKLNAVAAISPPVDPINAMIAIRLAPSIYRNYFFRKWSASLKAKLAFFPEYNYGEELQKAKSLDDLNTVFIPRLTPYSTPNEYFSSYSIVQDRLSLLSVPSYLIASLDDPVVPSDDITKINRNNFLNIDIQRFGGHCGFIESLHADSWVEFHLVDIFKSST